MQFSPINSPSISKDSKKTQNTSSFVSAPSISSLSMTFTGNTNETPLTISSNPITSTSEYLTYPSAEIDIPLLTNDMLDDILGMHSDILDMHPDDILDMRPDDILDIHSDDILDTHPEVNILDMHPHPFAADTPNTDASDGMPPYPFTDDVLDIYQHSFALDTLDNIPDMPPHSSAFDTIDTDMPDMHPHSSTTSALQENINLEEQEFTQPNEHNNVESISAINAPQQDKTEARPQNSNTSPVAHMNTEALQESHQSPDELMLKSFLLDVFKENVEDYEQILFMAYVENNPLKNKYLDLSISALNTINICKLMKIRIAQLIYDTKDTSQLKNALYSNLANILTSYSRYHQLLEELKPQEIQIPIKISMKKIKKINKEVADEIQKLKKRNQCSQRYYDTILDQSQIIESLIIQETLLYLTEKKAMEIFKHKFINLSTDKIKEIILSCKILPENQNNTDIPQITEIQQESIESNEILMLKYLMENIFTIPFYFDSQILFKSYKEEHPLKNKYLTLMISTLKAQNAYLHIKTRIVQLTHLKQEENCTARQEEMIKTVLCKDFIELLTYSSSYYQLIEELKPSEIQITKKISTNEMNKINSAPVDQIRALQVQLRGTQRYYNTILNERQAITESQIIQNIFHYLTEEKIIRTIQKKFTTLSKDQIKKIVSSIKIPQPIEDNANIENVTISLQEKSESEEVLTLESMLIDIFENHFCYNEKALFDAYKNNICSKEDFLTLTISAIQAKRACIQIKTRIAQLIKFKQKENPRECEVSAMKNFLYRDLIDLFTNLSKYNQLIDKLQPSLIQTQEPAKKYIRIGAINKEIAELKHRKKAQLYQTKKHLDEIIMSKQVTEKQIIQNILFYLTEPKGIETFKEIFTSLTEDKIKETIARSISRIMENKEAIEATTNKLLSPKRQRDNLECIAPPAKKKDIQISKPSASLSKALLESTASSQCSSPTSALRFTQPQSEAFTAREASQVSTISTNSLSLLSFLSEKI